MKKEERITELHHALTMLDQEHDALRTDVDSKAEDMEQLSQQIKEKEELIEEHEHRVHELETELNGSRGESGRRGDEIEGLKREVKLAQREMEQLRTLINAASQREQELRQDLATMTQVHLSCITNYYNQLDKREIHPYTLIGKSSNP